MNYTLTRLNVTKGNATKQLSLDSEGHLIKNGDQTVSKGIAQTISVTDLTQLGQVITGLTSKQCLIHGIVTDSVPNDSRPVVTEAALQNHSYSSETVSRTKEFFQYGPHAISMLDIDSSDDPQKIIKILGEVIPAFKDLQYLLVHSASSSIKSRETQKWLVPPEQGGKHLYFLVEDGAHIPKLKDILKVKLALAGYSRIELSQPNKHNGISSCLERTLVDVSVFSPERIDFAAGANLTDSRIYQDRPPPRLIGGKKTSIAINQIPELSQEEWDRYHERLDSLKQETRPTRLKQAQLHLQQQHPRLKASILRKRAKQVLKNHEALILGFDVVLEFEGGSVTVRQLIKNPEAFLDKRFADPINGRKNKAKLFINDSQLCLHSFARGGTNYYFPQGKSAISCRSLKFVKVHQIHTRYFEQPIATRGIVALNYPMGGGKTQYLKNLVVELGAGQLYIVPSIVLAENGSIDLQFDFYQDPTSRDKDNVSVCVDSAYKYPSKPVLLFDEIEPIMDAIASDRFSKPQYDDFVKKIREAKLIILCDANLSAETLKFFHETTQCSIDLYVPSAKRQRDRHNHKAYGFLSESGLVDFIIQLINQGENVFIPCSSIEKSKQLEKLLRQYTSSLININSETRETPEVKAVLENPQLIKKYQVKIYTPTIGHGMSFDIDQKNYVCHFVNEHVGTPHDALQMPFRFRGSFDLYFHITSAGHRLETDPKQTLKQALKERLLADQTFQDEVISSLIDKKDYTIDEFDQYVAQRLSYNNDLKNNYRDEYIKGLTSRGFTYIEVTDLKNCTSLREVKTAIQEQAIADILAAEPLTSSQVEKLRTQFQKTPKEQAQLTRFFLESFYKTTISKELIHYDKQGRRRDAIRRIESIKMSALTRIQKIKRDRERPLLFQKKEELLRLVGTHLFRAAGIQIQPDGSLHAPPKQRLNLETMHEFIQWLQTEEGRTACHFVKKMRKDATTSMQYLNGLLNLYGIELIAVQESEGERRRSYFINQSALEQLNDYLSRRQSDFLEKQQHHSTVTNVYLYNDECDVMSLKSKEKVPKLASWSLLDVSNVIEELNTSLDVDLQEQIYFRYRELEWVPTRWNALDVDQLIIKPLGLQVDCHLVLAYMSRHYLEPSGTI